MDRPQPIHRTVRVVPAVVVVVVSRSQSLPPDRFSPPPVSRSGIDTRQLHASLRTLSITVGIATAVALILFAFSLITAVPALANGPNDGTPLPDAESDEAVITAASSLIPVILLSGVFIRLVWIPPPQSRDTVKSIIPVTLVGAGGNKLKRQSQVNGTAAAGGVTYVVLPGGVDTGTDGAGAEPRGAGVGAGAGTRVTEAATVGASTAAPLPSLVDSPAGPPIDHQ